PDDERDVIEPTGDVLDAEPNECTERRGPAHDLDARALGSGDRLERLAVAPAHADDDLRSFAQPLEADRVAFVHDLHFAVRRWSEALRRRSVFGLDDREHAGLEVVRL